ncbi:MAG: NUDIX domain-containing protein [Anaerolineales bacterium]
MRNKLPVAVHLFFLRDKQILLLRRFNTGYEDGNYSVVAGHVDAGESVMQAAIREAREEVGIILQPADIQIVHVMNRKSDDERIDFLWQSDIGLAKLQIMSRKNAMSCPGQPWTPCLTI